MHLVCCYNVIQLKLLFHCTLRKFKIPQGAQSAIRGSLDGGSRTVPATLHSSDDSEAKPVNFRQVNSAPDLK